MRDWLAAGASWGRGRSSKGTSKAPLAARAAAARETGVSWPSCPGPVAFVGFGLALEGSARQGSRSKISSEDGLLNPILETLTRKPSSCAPACVRECCPACLLLPALVRALTFSQIRFESSRMEPSPSTLRARSLVSLGSHLHAPPPSSSLSPPPPGERLPPSGLPCTRTAPSDMYVAAEEGMEV